MPKDPILYREEFYESLKNGMIRHLDWCSVNTELGAMVEPKSRLAFRNEVTQIDIVDFASNKLSFLPEDEFYRRFGTGGRIFCLDFTW